MESVGKSCQLLGFKNTFVGHFVAILGSHYSLQLRVEIEFDQIDTN